MITLRKLLAQEVEPLIRAAFAEDLKMLATYGDMPNQSLDTAANDFLSAMQPDDLFFRIENEAGAYVGFFSCSAPATKINFHLRNAFRSDDYLDAFYNLVIETISNGFYSSIGSNNLSSIPNIIKPPAFEVDDRTAFHGKDFVLLEDN